jgi:hypothetical protein
MTYVKKFYNNRNELFSGFQAAFLDIFIIHQLLTLKIEHTMNYFQISLYV